MHQKSININIIILLNYASFFLDEPLSKFHIRSMNDKFKKKKKTRTSFQTHQNTDSKFERETQQKCVDIII